MADDLLSKYGLTREPQEDLLGKYGLTKADVPVTKGMGDLSRRDRAEPQSLSERVFSSKDGETPFFNFEGAEGKKPIGKFIGDRFSHPDSEAKGMMESMAYPGGVTSTAAMDLIKRALSLNKDSVSKEDWQQALLGRAKPPSEHFKDMGYGKLVQYGLGLPIQAYTDPMNSILNKGNVLSELPAINKDFIMKGLKQYGRDPIEPIITAGKMVTNPIQTLLTKGAYETFAGPFRKANAELVQKWRNAEGFGKQALTKLLWNKGEPLVGGFTKGNEEIAQEIDALRRATGQRIGNTLKDAGGDDLIHVAPDLADNVDLHRIDELREAAKNVPPPKAPKADPDPFALEEARNPSAPPPPKPIDELPQSAPSHIDWLKQKLRGNKEERQAALDLMSQSAPELESVIQKTGKHLKNDGDRQDALNFFDGLLNDIAEGPRTLQEMQDWKVSVQNRAARSEPMGTDAFAKSFVPNVEKSAHAEAANEFGELIDDIVSKKLGSEKALERSMDKARYSVLRRAQRPVDRIVKTEASRPGLSKFDLVAGGAGVGAGGSSGQWWPLLTAMGAKVANEVSRSPRLGTGLGRAMNTVGKSNVWDNMLRDFLMNKATQGDKDGRK